LLCGALLGRVLGLPAQDLINLGAWPRKSSSFHSRDDELTDKLASSTALAGYNRGRDWFFQTLNRMQEKEGRRCQTFHIPIPDHRAHPELTTDDMATSDFGYLPLLEGDRGLYWRRSPARIRRKIFIIRRCALLSGTTWIRGATNPRIVMVENQNCAFWAFRRKIFRICCC
jgi:hypothetical protein